MGENNNQEKWGGWLGGIWCIARAPSQNSIKVKKQNSTTSKQL